jgi:hypothetical protein
MTYKLYKTIDNKNAVILENDNGSMSSFIFAPDNTDYQRFKIDLANGAQLSDANNNIMTANQISAFISTLP